jgi:ECF transporter S component (folate family)
LRVKCQTDGKLPLDEKSFDLRCNRRIPLPLKSFSLLMWLLPLLREEVFFLKKTKMIVFLGLMIALNVVLSRFLSFSSGWMRIGVSFIPVVVGAMLCGPVLGGMAAAVADVLGFFIVSTGGYIPGITISAFLSGAIFGLLLYKKDRSVSRILISSAISCLVIEAGLNSYWLYLAIPGNTFMSIFLWRLVYNIIMTAVETIVIYELWPVLMRLKLRSGS